MNKYFFIITLVLFSCNATNESEKHEKISEDLDLINDDKIPDSLIRYVTDAKFKIYLRMANKPIVCNTKPHSLVPSVTYGTLKTKLVQLQKKSTGLHVGFVFVKDDSTVYTSNDSSTSSYVTGVIYKDKELNNYVFFNGDNIIYDNNMLTAKDTVSFEKYLIESDNTDLWLKKYVRKVLSK